jgi:two-component system nitrate/nitrite response regulator NarL
VDHQVNSAGFRPEHEGLRAVLAQLPDVVVMADTDCRVLFTNLPAPSNGSGPGVASLASVSEAFPIFHPDGRPYGIEEWPLVRSLRTGHPVWGEEFFRRDDNGGRTVFSGSAMPVYGADGRIVGAVSVARDVTARVRSEQALRQADRRNDRILESIADAFFVLDGQWRFAYLNERAVHVLARLLDRRIGRQNLLGKSVWEMLPAMLATESEVNFRRAVREQTPIAYEYLYPGRQRWFDVRVTPVAEGLAVYLRDITARKRAEEQRERSVRQQQLVAELGLRALENDDLDALLGDAAALVARTLGADLAAIAQLQRGGDELVLRAGVGFKDDAIGKATTSAARDSLMGYALMVGEPVVSQDLARDERFSLAPVIAEHRPVSGATVIIEGRDEPFGALAVFSTRRRAFSAIDVSFLQAVANVLATAAERATSQRRLVDVREEERRRIARDLHDEALQGLSEVLAAATTAGAGGANGLMQQLVPAVKRVGRQLRAAIYDLRLGGEEDRDFAELLTTLVALHRAMADHCRIHLELRPGVPAGSLGKRGSEVLRVVGEALVNARRHSGARNIYVEAWGSGNRLCVSVTDDGRGLGNGVDPAGPGGAGLEGMRERAAVLDAELTVDGEGGAGTRVRLEVPLAPGADAEDEEVRVLLVEDHASVRQAIAATFEREPDFVVTGQAASLAEARDMLHDVDVAVVDLRLPDGDGGELIRELRRVNPRAQSLVLSASLDRPLIARAIASGAAGTLDKTAHLDEVVTSVRRLRAGGTLVPVGEAMELLRLAGRLREQERDDRRAIERLTAREREVLQSLADGLDNQQVAARLHITLRTQRNHVANILTKLGVHSQLQALVFALRYGVVEIR